VHQHFHHKRLGCIRLRHTFSQPALAFLCLAVAILGLPAASGQACPDFYWHLLLSEDILAHRSLRFADTLSFSP